MKTKTGKRYTPRNNLTVCQYSFILVYRKTTPVFGYVKYYILELELGANIARIVFGSGCVTVFVLYLSHLWNKVKSNCKDLIKLFLTPISFSFQYSDIILNIKCICF